MPCRNYMRQCHIFCAAISISAYRMEDKITHAQLSNLLSIKTREYVPHGRDNWYASMYINKLLHNANRSAVDERDLSHIVRGADLSVPHCLATGI